VGALVGDGTEKRVATSSVSTYRSGSVQQHPDGAVVPGQRRAPDQPDVAGSRAVAAPLVSVEEVRAGKRVGRRSYDSPSQSAIVCSVTSPSPPAALP
jgi:hypothetical protein